MTSPGGTDESWTAGQRRRTAARAVASALALAAAYLLIACWAMRSVLPAPRVLLPIAAAIEEPASRILTQSDQRMAVWGISRSARLLPTRPAELFGYGQCYPMHGSLALGEHMLGEGLLGALPWAATRDPILTYNVAVIASLWVAALAMYALVRACTGSPGAAFVAGLLFGFDPARIANPVHPFVHGNLWTPLVLLFLHRLVIRSRWRDVLGLSLAAVLQLLESFYQTLACAVLAGLYGAWLLVRHRHRIPALLPKLAVVAGVVGTVCWAVLGPYLHVRATWEVLSGRELRLYALTDFGPRGGGWPGGIAVGLAAVALLDRLRGPRRGASGDPRLVALTAALAIVWMSVAEVPVPFLGVAVPSPFALARHVIPGMDAVRALGAVHFGATLAVVVLAGYGVLALTERARPVVRRLVATLLVVAAAAEIFHPGVARWSFGARVDLDAWVARPPAPVVSLFRWMPDGAVLDVPFSFGLRGMLRDMPSFLLLAAYHRRPVAACYNSFTVPIQADIERLAGRLPEPAAADALAALGFRTLLVHTNLLFEADRRAALRPDRLAASGRARLTGQAGALLRYDLQSPIPVAASFVPLAATAEIGEPAEATPPRTRLDVTFRNRTAATYRHPEPIEPTRLLVRWETPSGALVAAAEVTALLPLALAPGDQGVRSVDVPVPGAAGDYRLSLAPAASPDLIVARRAVRVLPRAPPPAAGGG